MSAALDRAATIAWYRRFADSEARGESPIYEEWSRGVASDPQLLDLIDALPRPKRQPNLIFAVSRLLGAPEGSYSDWRAWAIDNHSRWAAAALTRSTQTNEPRRLAPVLPVLAGIRGPIALVEVGASAGLCLYPDRYSYRYTSGYAGDAAGGDEVDTNDVVSVRRDPVDGPSPVLLDCATTGDVPIPAHMPAIAWRAGIDLDPLDVDNAEDRLWLETLVWPEQHERRARLWAAVEIARSDPPIIMRGDAADSLAALAATAPAGTTVVVVTAGVLVYLGAGHRQRFIDVVTTIGATWISLEGASVLAPLIPAMAEGLRRSPAPRPGSFVLGLDGVPVAWCGPHGQTLDWIG